MSWVYDYRIFSYVISLGSTLAVFAAGIATLQFGHVDIDISYTYARLGIASAVLTFFPLLFILLRECVNRPVDVKTELIILPILSVFWLAAGGVTVVTRTNVFGHGPCDDFTDFTQNGLCAYAEPISTFSFVPAGLMLSYELLLLLIGSCGERREKPIWAHPVRGPAIREVGF
ncbi:hypothetical protein TRAPUB_6168 [Trametes pubescens]|uniref:MARVEL domain-containing protein n=1 Tax=Trametes pubescens TaxID=154538 RepID=A0A1M2V6N0_TRAPU|nr:hypothetical protein TRAPUB_6168 [Trametes pubescens]